MPNLEIKARCGNLDSARKAAESLGGAFLWKDEQVDTYFNTKAGKLKLRESKLNGSELLPYIKSDVGGIKRSDYSRIPVSNPDLVKDLLEQTLGKKFEVRKSREVYLIGNVRVHLDEVADLGSFIEFEAVFEDDTSETQVLEKQKVSGLMEKFGIKGPDLLEGSYPELLAAKIS